MYLLQSHTLGAWELFKARLVGYQAMLCTVAKETSLSNHLGAALAGTTAPPELGLRALHSGQLQRADGCPT